MSRPRDIPRWRRPVQLLSLALVTGVLLGLAQLTPSASSAAGLAVALGLLLLFGVLCSEILDAVSLPHLTGYLCAGMLVGPYGIRLINHATVDELGQVNTLALSLIALAGGLELKAGALRQGARSLGIATATHTILGIVIVGLGFLALRSEIPFAASLSLPAAMATALLWSVLSISRSPSATLGILAQTRADGHLTRYALAFVMSSDVVVVSLMAMSVALARPFLLPGSEITVHALSSLAHELLGSVSVGTCLGLILAFYLRWVGLHLIVLLLLLSFGVSAAVGYLHLEPLLTFIVAGFVVQNFSVQGDRLLAAIERTGAVVFVVFFATAGAHVDLELLSRLWPIALSLVLLRGGATVLSQHIASTWAGDVKVLRKWGWSPLISQAGLTLGLSTAIEHSFPSLGDSFRSLVIATVALNEIVGPILFKLGLERAGESGRGQSSTAAPEESDAEQSPRPRWIP